MRPAVQVYSEDLATRGSQFACLPAPRCAPYIHSSSDPPLTSFASQSELSYSSYVSQIASNAAPAPLTDREKELAEIRSTEASEQVESTPGRSMIYGSMSGGSGASVGLPWSEGATSKVKTGLENVGDLVQLVRCSL